MHSSLRKISAGYLTDPAFQGYHDAKLLVIKEEETVHLNKVEQEFFKIAEKSLVKHYSQWMNQNLLPCAIASQEQEICKVFASYFCVDGNTEDCTFYSKIHAVEISTSELIEFIQSYGSFRTDISSSLLVHMDAVKEIANGKKLYHTEGSKINAELQFFVSYTFLLLPSHTQFV